MAAEWRFLRNVLPIGRQQQSPATAALARWQVLVFDASPQSLLCQAPESANLSTFSRNQWRTLWSNGASVQSFDGTLVCLSDRICRLRNEVLTTTKAHRCREGNLCCRYKVEILSAEPVTGGKPNVLWRSAESRFLDFCNCASLQEGDDRLRRVDAEETSAFSIRSIFGKNISIDSLTDEYDIGAEEPHGGRVWRTLRLTDHGLRKCRLPKPLLQKADALYAQLAQSDDAAQDYDPNYVETQGYLLMPHKGGVAVELQCDYRFDPCDPTLYRLRLEEPGGLDQSQKLSTESFIATHANLVPWDELEAFSIAPDLGSVLYVQDHQLFWRTINGQTTEFGPISDFRGWQWIDSSRLQRAEHLWLTTPAQAAAS